MTETKSVSTNYKGSGLSVVSGSQWNPSAEVSEIELIYGCGLFKFSCLVFLFMSMASLEYYLRLLLFTGFVNTVSLIITKSLSVWHMLIHAGFPFIKFRKRNTSFQFYFLPGMTMSTSGKLMRKKKRKKKRGARNNNIIEGGRLNSQNIITDCR